MVKDGRGTTYWTGNVYATRIGANDNVFPRIAYHRIDAIAMQDTLWTLIGIKQQTTFVLPLLVRSAVYPMNTLSVNADEHRFAVIGTDASDGLLPCRLFLGHPCQFSVVV